MKRKRLWIILFVLAVLAPLGIWLPERFGAGGAWGEWGSEEVRKLVGYVPEGMRRLEELWKAPLADYRIRGFGEWVGYALSALLGAGLVVLAAYLLGRAMARKSEGKR
jgi:hypothetical protein